MKIKRDHLQKMKDFAVKNYTQMALPCEVSKTVLDDGEIRTLCYVESIISFFNREGLLKEEVTIDYSTRTYDSPED